MLTAQTAACRDIQLLLPATHLSTRRRLKTVCTTIFTKGSPFDWDVSERCTSCYIIPAQAGKILSQKYLQKPLLLHIPIISRKIYYMCSIIHLNSDVRWCLTCNMPFNVHTQTPEMHLEASLRLTVLLKHTCTPDPTETTHLPPELQPLMERNPSSG